MNDKMIVMFDKSAEDIPVLIVAREGYGFSLSPTFNVIKTLTGDNAEKAYNMLTQKGQQDEEAEHHHDS